MQALLEQCYNYTFRMHETFVAQWDFCGLVCAGGSIRKFILRSILNYTNLKVYMILSACLVHAIQILILYSNPKNRGSHTKKSCLVHEI